MTPSVTIAVTGLSGSGKTVFLTSVIHHLLHWNREEMRLFPKKALAYPVRAEVRSLPPSSWIKRFVPGIGPGGRLARFPYEENLNRLKQSPPQWPVSTREPSEFGLRVSYRQTVQRDGGKPVPHGKWHDIDLTLVDYPGEWLLDVPLLKKDFAAWSAEEIARAKQPHRAPYSAEWLSKLEQCPPTQPLSPPAAAELVAAYRAYIRSCSESDAGIAHRQPGFFLNCPPEHAKKPYMEFCPLSLAGERSRRRGGTLREAFAGRYKEYKKKLVRPFYEQTFRRADVQIVLIDVLKILQQGLSAYSEHKQCLDAILSGFAYGKQSWFRQRICRSIFTASKADHATHLQHENMRSLVRDITSAARDTVVTGRKADAVSPAPTYVSAHCSTRSVQHVEEGVNRTRLRGIVIGHEDKGEVDWLMPEIESTFPADDWDTSRYRCYRFQPAEFPKKEGTSPPHINLDAVLGLALQSWMKIGGRLHHG